MYYYNFQRMIKDLYSLMCMPENQEFQYTLKILLDETMCEYLKMNNVPFECQEEFLETMFYDCQKAVVDYKNKKFDYMG